MKIINVNQVEARDVSADPLFFGGKVTTQPILEEAHEGKRVQVITVSFALGARNKLHTHVTEQILIVTEGKGIVATKNEEHIVTPGMFVYVAPNEEHWHGATDDSTFSIYRFWASLINSKSRKPKNRQQPAFYTTT